MTVIIQSGLVYDLDEMVYHADPIPGGSLSSTVAKHLSPPSCPALARHKMLHREHRDAYDIGSVTHMLVLGTGCEIVEITADDWRTKTAKEGRDDARVRGAVALLTRDYEVAHTMADAVRAHPRATGLFVGGHAEVSAFWREPVPYTDDLTWCRARFDYLKPGMIVDLKTTSAGTSDQEIQRSVAKYRYHIQESFYRRAIYRLTKEWPVFLFVFVDTTPPHLVRIVELDNPTRDQGSRDVDTALKIWHDCTTTGIWPGRDTDIGMIGLPRWARDGVDT